MRNPEDIMADYLLKGAKMLDKACPVCGSPLFTVKGDTYCVVCRENAGKETAAPVKMVVSEEKKYFAPEEVITEVFEAFSDDLVYEGLRSAVLSLCGRIKNESRPKDCLILMESVSIGIDAMGRMKKQN